VENIGQSLMVPRGVPGLTALKLDMSEVYEAERRLSEVANANPVVASQLMGYFNKACSDVNKYLAWIEYEILQAKKFYSLSRATVILEKAPAEFAKIKDIGGMKYNEDFRDAVVAKDLECQQRLDTLNMLEATKVLLTSKSWSFIRAFNACQSMWENRDIRAAQPILNGNIGQTYDQPQESFMGVSQIGRKNG
jgi:hypothetical protein